MVDSIEEGKISVDLHDPISLRQNDGTNVEMTEIPAQERLVLDPSNNIVHLP